MSLLLSKNKRKRNTLRSGLSTLGSEKWHIEQVHGRCGCLVMRRMTEVFGFKWERSEFAGLLEISGIMPLIH